MLANVNEIKYLRQPDSIKHANTEQHMQQLGLTTCRCKITQFCSYVEML